MIKVLPLVVTTVSLAFMAGCGTSTQKPVPKKPTDPVQAIRTNAQLVVDTMKTKVGVDLRYDAESIKWLDGYIERNRGTLDQATKSKLVDTFGSYLGEVIIRQYGGQWEEYQGTWAVSFGKDNKAFPFGKVAKQFQNGAEDSIYSFYCVLPTVMKLDKKSGAESPVPPAAIMSEEEGIKYLQTHPPSGPSCQLAISDSFTFAGQPDAMGAGMAVLVDKMLGLGYVPDGFEQKKGFKLYRYNKR